MYLFRRNLLVGIADKDRLNRFSRIERSRLEGHESLPVGAASLRKDHELRPRISAPDPPDDLLDGLLSRLGIFPGHAQGLGALDTFPDERDGLVLLPTHDVGQSGKEGGEAVEKGGVGRDHQDRCLLRTGLDALNVHGEESRDPEGHPPEEGTGGSEHFAISGQRVPGFLFVTEAPEGEERAHVSADHREEKEEDPDGHQEKGAPDRLDPVHGPQSESVSEGIHNWGLCLIPR